MRLVVLLISLSVFVTASPAWAWVFSARDVLTVCLAWSSEPHRAYAVFESQGWARVSEDTYSEYETDIGVAFAAAAYMRPRPVHGTTFGVEQWQNMWPRVGSYLEKLRGEKGFALFQHAETGALLLADEVGIEAKTSFSCLLAVPKTQLGGSSYFPKLNVVAAPSLSYSTRESFDADSVRSIVGVQSASLAPDAISKALAIQTNVGAAFFIHVSHPKSVFEP